METVSKNTLRHSVVFLSLLLLFGAAVVWNINTGSVAISVREILTLLFRKKEIESGALAADLPAFNIIWKIRLPRLLLAAVLGGALSLSGFLLQTFFRNPIAGPFVLGISSGSKMFLAVVTIALFVLAFTGKIRDMSMLLVVGIMISYICSAVTDFLINFAKESEIVNLTHWSLGSFSAASWQDVRISALIVLPAFLCTFFLSKPISAYALGEGYAQSLGVNIRLFRVLLILFSSVLSACVTAFAGPISFVGIAVPHICRVWLKTAKPVLMIPACFFCGAVFCMICDLIARTVFSPTELSVGTVTSAIGAPIVIWLMAARGAKRNE